MDRTSNSIYAEVLYDLFAGKDYAADVIELKGLVGARRPSAATWLDVACGTGRHLQELRHSFEVAGVDISPEMLAVTRRNVGPSVALHEGDFTTFDLGETFDVVSCLTSSICHAVTADGLAAAIARMGAHVRSDGLMLVERYFSAEDWDDSRVGVRHVQQGPLRATQYHVSRREGASAELHVHYLLARPGLVEHDDEHFQVGLLSDHDYDAAFERADFAHRELLEDALTGRGLYVASRAPLAS